MKVTSTSTVTVHYRGTLTDGSVFDDSKVRGEAIEVPMGSNQVIPGFEEALIGMTAGQKKTITLSSDEAYGEPNPAAFQTVPREAFPEDYEFEVGTTVQGNGPTGQPVLARIESFDPAGVTLNFNHPLAGQDLNFVLEVIEVVDTEASDDSETTE